MTAVPFRHRRLTLLVVLCAVLGAGAVRAQVPRFEVVEQSDRRIVMDVAIDWPQPLRASLDSARVSALDAPALTAIARGLTHAEHTLGLPHFAQPRLTVLAADFDEVTVPLAAQPPTLFAEPSAEALGLGWQRKTPALSVRAKLFGYDAERGALRRYRRLRLALDLPPPAAAKARTAPNPHLAIDRSALADGALFRLPITQEGIYRIDRQFLSDLGLSPGSIEPNNLRILGNGGVPLPAPNSAPRIPDLAENPVFVRGGGDGSFGDNDVLLFYAAPPHGWTYDPATERWAHFVHPFSNENVYFLKVAATPGPRVGNPAFADLPGAQSVEQVTGRFFRDVDQTVWSKEHGTGHTWVSNQIRSGATFPVLEDVSLPGRVAGEVGFHTRVAINSNPIASVFFERGGVRLATARAGLVGRRAQDPAALPAETIFAETIPVGQPISLTMRLEQQINEPQAALDWVRVFYPKALQAQDGYLRFHTPEGQAGVFEFVLRGFGQAPQVWDVTTPGTIQRLGTRQVGNTYRVQVTANDAGAPLELVAFVESAAREAEPSLVASVPNQNLHGLTNFPDFVIIAPEAFLEPANELAEHRRQDGLVVEVAVIDAVYNEFSGGVPDMRAIRDYLKFLYDRSDDPATLFRYALLFGDGHYDFRGLATDENDLDNWIFPYETEDSFVPDRSFTSDDYFGLLDDDEGEWRYFDFRNISTERVDIGIGRFPVQTLAEAQRLVDKVKRYEDPATFGPWRSLYTFAADDGPTGQSASQNDFDLHVQNVDQVAEFVRTPSRMDIRKIYAESFERVFRNGFRIPDAKAEIRAALENGTLLFNYSGHGGPNGLAQEELFTKEDAAALTNGDKQAIFVTATCSFGWWDLNDGQSGAEALLLNPNGGAVALMTTVRLVYTSGDTTSLNAGLNRALNTALFLKDEAGLPRRLGDVLRETKNTPVGLQGNSRKFSLLGDPTMRLGIPARTTEVEQINGQPVGQQPIQMSALERITLTGSVRTLGGQVDGGFDGLVNLSVFDARRQVALLQQVYMPNPYYRIQEDLIWRGEVRANGGRFSATFVVPKDISYSQDEGRITAYAASDAAHALGFTSDFIVGGTAANPPDDSEGPRISLFLNDTTFVSGGLTRPEPELIVKLFDESGINAVGAGVGHEMLLVLNDDEGRAIDISNAFRSAENSFQRGEVRWRLTDLEPGPGQLRVRAWDVLNNSATNAIEFVVGDDAVLDVRNVYNYPNPMNRQTRFIFEHNQLPGTAARVQLRIYTLNGRPLRTFETDEVLPGGILPGGPVQVVWDGRDDDFDRVATGVYLYKLRVEVDDADGERQVIERIEKLAVIR